MRYIATICFLAITVFAFGQSNISPDSIAIMLQGRMACGMISKPAGEKPVIRIRCIATKSYTEPLLIIDGIPFEYMVMSKLDPNDVESIAVLNDVIAQAIYGCRAANGVIIITTKSSNIREFIVKDFLDGSPVPGATMTFIPQDDKKDTLMFVANDSGMVVTDKIKYGREYEVIVSSVGYKNLSMINGKKKSQDILLERDMKVCNEVMVTSYVSGRRCGGCRVGVIWTYGEHERAGSVAHVNLYPSPAQRGSTVTIDLKAEVNEELQLRLFSLDGRLLLSQTKKVMKGNNRFTVQADNRWTPGTYLIQLTDVKGKVVLKEKLVIQ